MLYTLQARHTGLHFQSTLFILWCHSNTRLSNVFNQRLPKDRGELVNYFIEGERWVVEEYLHGGDTVLPETVSHL